MIFHSFKLQIRGYGFFKNQMVYTLHIFVKIVWIFHTYLQTYAHTCIYALFWYIGKNINCAFVLDLWINMYPVSAAHFPWLTFLNNKTNNCLLIKKKGITYECMKGYKYGLVTRSNPIKPGRAINRDFELNINWYFFCCRFIWRNNVYLKIIINYSSRPIRRMCF